jgi:Cu/Ag efflux protein CusF
MMGTEENRGRIMLRTLFSLCFAVLLVPVCDLAAQNAVSTESTTTATVDRIDRFSRTLTLRRDNSIISMVTVDPSEKLFDDLKTGDRITVRFVDSVVVQVRPAAALGLRDTTAEAQAGNDNVINQIRQVVTIERIDPDGQFVMFRTEDGMRATRVVSDRRLLQGIRAGDRVEVTLTRERAVSVERARP